MPSGKSCPCRFQTESLNQSNRGATNTYSYLDVPGHGYSNITNITAFWLDSQCSIITDMARVAKCKATYEENIYVGLENKPGTYFEGSPNCSPSAVGFSGWRSFLGRCKAPPAVIQ